MNPNIKFIPLKSAASVTPSLSLFPYGNDGRAGWHSDKIMLFFLAKNQVPLSCFVKPTEVSEER